MSETSDNTLLLRVLDERAKATEFDRMVASAIRALEAKVRELESVPRAGVLVPEQALAELRAERARLAAEVKEADGVIAVWRRRTQEAEAEVAALRAERTQVGWCRYVYRHERAARIVLCDSDAPSAFPVYRIDAARPAGEQ